MHLSALLIRHLFSPLSSNNGILANAKNLGYFAFGKNLKKTTFCLRQKSGRDANSKSLLCRGNPIGIYAGNAGWSSPVARQAHNLKAAGSNPAPATRYFPNRQNNKAPDRKNGRGFAVFAKWHGDARFDVGNRCGKLSLVPQLS